MTRNASNRGVGPGERKSRRRMVKRGRGPGNIRMAQGAVVIVIPGRMIWVGGLGEIGLMARIAGGRLAGVQVVTMALQTCGGSVGTLQHERLVGVGRIYPRP